MKTYSKQPRNRSYASKGGGFTLIELMITVVIVGILSTVAYAAYTQFVQRAKRTEGMTSLLQAAQQQERYFTVNNTYTVDSGLAKIPAKSEQGSYSIVVTANGNIATGFVATATPVGWVDSKCGALSLNNAGVKTPPPSSQPDCWK